MFILIILVLGVFLGAKLIPQNLKKLNEKLQIILIAFLIFAMGISLGSRENIGSELRELGMDSLVLAVFPIFFSGLCVYIITRKWKR